MTWYLELLKNKLFTFYLTWPDMLSVPTFQDFVLYCFVSGSVIVCPDPSIYNLFGILKVTEEKSRFGSESVSKHHGSGTLFDGNMD